MGAVQGAVLARYLIPAQPNRDGRPRGGARFSRPLQYDVGVMLRARARRRRVHDSNWACSAATARTRPRTATPPMMGGDAIVLRPFREFALGLSGARDGDDSLRWCADAPGAAAAPRCWRVSRRGACAASRSAGTSSAGASFGVVIAWSRDQAHGAAGGYRAACTVRGRRAPRCRRARIARSRSRHRPSAREAAGRGSRVVVGREAVARRRARTPRSRGVVNY